MDELDQEKRKRGKLRWRITLSRPPTHQRSQKKKEKEKKKKGLVKQYAGFQKKTPRPEDNPSSASFGTLEGGKKKKKNKAATSFRKRGGEPNNENSRPPPTPLPPLVSQERGKKEKDLALNSTKKKRPRSTRPICTKTPAGKPSRKKKCPLCGDINLY